MIRAANDPMMHGGFGIIAGLVIGALILGYYYLKDGSL